MTAEEILSIHTDIFNRVLKEQDYAALEGLYAGDYMLVRPDGSVLNKQEVLQDLRIGGLRFHSIELGQTEVRMYGSTAVLTAESQAVSSRYGMESRSHFRLIAVYVQQGQSIKLVHFQSTDIGTGSAVPGRADAAESEGPAIERAVPITLRINGKNYQLRLDPRATLLDCLRETLALTGTKKGCDHGQCGACTVHVNGKRVLSCLNLALLNDGNEITTIEGLGMSEAMHPMQAAFLACDAYQCGYCTSGQIMSSVALLKEPCGPDDADVKELMSGNICRCGAYANIVAAIQQVRKHA